MKREYIALLITLALSVGASLAQQQYTKFIETAQYYASKNRSMFRFDLSQRYAVANQESLNSYHSQFDENWGTVVMMLSISKITGYSMGKMLTIYNRTKPIDWNKIIQEFVKCQPMQDSLNYLLNQQIENWRLQTR